MTRQTICTFVRVVGVAIRLATDSNDVVSRTKLPAFLTAYFSMYVSIQSIQILGLAASLGLYKAARREDCFGGRRNKSMAKSRQKISRFRICCVMKDLSSGRSHRKE